MGHQPTSAPNLTRTIETYTLAANRLAAGLGANGEATNVRTIFHSHVNGYLAEVASTRAPATAKQRYAESLQELTRPIWTATGTP